MRFSADETFDVGCDTGSPVSNDYKAPFKFTGKLKKLEIKLEDEQLTPEEHAHVKTLHAAAEAARH
jgi:arylsulfatase